MGPAVVMASPDDCGIRKHFRYRGRHRGRLLRIIRIELRKVPVSPSSAGDRRLVKQLLAAGALMGDVPLMSTITAIFEPAADGSLHLPVPEELRHRRIRVVALLTEADISGEGVPPPPGNAREWVQRARGTVRLLPGESADDLRRAYYAEKYGTES